MGTKTQSSAGAWQKYTGAGASKSVKYQTIQFAEVMDNTDGSKMGRLRVYIVGSRGNKLDQNNWRTVSWSSPFAGATNLDDTIKGGEGKPEDKIENSYQATQRSYGMWMTPPDIGNIVIVAFVDGNENMGVCLGCMFQPGINHMIPGIAKGATFGEDSPLVPVAEANRKSDEVNNNYSLYKSKPNTIDSVRRAKHDPLFESLTDQGLENDNIRGLTDSSARRESPSQVFGFLTPGGHQFVMDDASQKHIRLRTIGGSQILLDDTNNTIYVINSQGTGWVEITNQGKIEVWGADSISLRSEKDVNIRADRDLNLESGRHVNIRARYTDENNQPTSTKTLTPTKGNVHIQTAGSFKVTSGTDNTDNIDMSTTGSTNVYSGVDLKLTQLGSSHINSGTTHRETAANGSGRIDMNSPGFDASVCVPVTGIPLQVDGEGNLLYTNVLEMRQGEALNSPRVTETQRGSINTRFPTREPYPDHESQSTANSGESS